MRAIRVGLLGIGTVGGGTWEVLNRNAGEIRRRAGRAKLAQLRKARPTPSSASTGLPPTQAPVMIYFEKERNTRILERVREMLDSKGIKYTLLDVGGDDVTKDFVMREARCKDDELPVVFVGSSPVGGYGALVDWDVSGRLANALAGG